MYLVHLYYILPYLTPSKISLTMNNESLFLAFAGSELSLASKALLIQESLETKSRFSVPVFPKVEFHREKSNRSLTRIVFPTRQQTSTRLSE